MITFKELLRLMASKMQVTCGFVHTPPGIGLALTSVIGLLMRDIVLTRDEIDGLMSGLLTSDAPPIGTTRLNDLAHQQRGRPRTQLPIRTSTQLPPLNGEVMFRSTTHLDNQSAVIARSPLTDAVQRPRRNALMKTTRRENVIQL